MFDQRIPSYEADSRSAMLAEIQATVTGILGQNRPVATRSAITMNILMATQQRETIIRQLIVRNTIFYRLKTLLNII